MSGWNHKLEGLQLNPEESLHSLEFATSQEAWEKLNEGFLRLEPALFGIRFAEPPGIAEPVMTPTISCAKRSFSLLYFEISMSVFAS